MYSDTMSIYLVIVMDIVCVEKNHFNIGHNSKNTTRTEGQTSFSVKLQASLFFSTVWVTVIYICSFIAKEFQISGEAILAKFLFVGLWLMFRTIFWHWWEKTKKNPLVSFIWWHWNSLSFYPLIKILGLVTANEIFKAVPINCTVIIMYCKQKNIH